MLVIRFGKSTSKNYDYALYIAESFDHYNSLGEKPFHEILIDDYEIIEKADYLLELVQIIADWKSSSFRLKGKITGYWDLREYIEQTISFNLINHKELITRRN